MKRVLARIGLGVLAIVGLYITIMIGMVAVGFVAGFASTYRSRPPATTIQYIHCTDAHPSPECAELAKSRPVPPKP